MTAAEAERSGTLVIEAEEHLQKPTARRRS